MILMKIIPVLALVGFAMPCAAFSDVVYSDDFGRISLGPAYTEYVSAGDGGAVMNGSFLSLTNDVSAATNLNGRISVTAAFGNFATPFSGTLAANQGPVSWEIGFRYDRAVEPSGFAGAKYGAAFVLAASQGDFMGGSGYAVVYGSQATPEPFRLVRYSGGLGADANLVAMVSTAGAGLAGINDYASIRVTYAPTDGTWRLFVRDDGATGWSDPASINDGNLVGVASDSVYTGAALTHTGFFWNYSTAATQTVRFDNLRISVVPESGVFGAVSLFAFVSMVARRRFRRARVIA